MDMDGHNCARAAIADWIQKGQDNVGMGICPILHKPPCKRDLIMNASPKEQIHRWCRKHGFPLPSPPPEPAPEEQEDESHNDNERITILKGESDHHCDVLGTPELQHHRNNGAISSLDIDGSMESGAAMQSLSSVISAKEDCVVDFGREEEAPAPANHHHHQQQQMRMTKKQCKLPVLIYRNPHFSTCFCRRNDMP